MRRFLLLFCTFCLFSSLAVAQVDYHPRIKTVETIQAEQRRVVSQWCRLDFEGARLASGGFGRYADITSIKVLPDSDLFYVVSRYEITRSADEDDVLVVIYQVLGTVSRLSGFTPGRDTFRVAFRTGERDGQRMVTDVAMPVNFVSRTAAADWVRTRIDAATGPDKLLWQRSLDALNQLDPAAKKSASAAQTNHPSAATNVAKPSEAAPKSPSRQSF